MQSIIAGSWPKNMDGTWPNHLPTKEHFSATATSFHLRRSIRNEAPIDGSGAIKCKTCDLYFKEYKPQYSEVEFKDGDQHCNHFYSRIVDEKSAAWKELFPAGGGILSTKRGLKLQI